MTQIDVISKKYIWFQQTILPQYFSGHVEKLYLPYFVKIKSVKKAID